VIPLAGLLEWAFTGLERMEFVGASRAAAAAVSLLIVVAWVRRPDQVLLVPIAYVAGLASSAIALLIAFRRRYPHFRIRIDARHWRQGLREALPLGLSFVVTQISYTFGTLALGLYEGQRPVGLYSAPQKVVLLLLSMAALFGTAVYPRMVVMYRRGRPSLERVMLLAARVMLAVAIPVAIGGAMVAGSLIRFFYGPGYEAGVPVFQILVWSIVAVFANAPFAFALLAAGGQKQYLTSATAGAAVNIIANIVLIPRLHLLGPAVATVGSEIVVLTMLVRYARRAGSISVTRVVLAAGGASIVMAAALYFVRAMPFPLQVVAGGLAYAAALALLGGTTREDIRMLRSLDPGPESA
jgi:O-antigen/teichoic acid export membrane protein